jgi:hypothetical protein
VHPQPDSPTEVTTATSRSRISDAPRRRAT